LLQETTDNWRVYHSSFDQLEKWLAEGEQTLRRSADEKLVSEKFKLSQQIALKRIHMKHQYTNIEYIID
jgi:hypothetical protein